MAAAKLFPTRKIIFEVAVHVVGAVLAYKLLNDPGLVSKVATIYWAYVGSMAITSSKVNVFWHLSSLLTKAIRVTLNEATSLAYRQSALSKLKKKKSRSRLIY